ncbi:DUF6455 family protein [Salinarimonas soli]|uniref:DUF6455 domain-containing protein n=1 Tax=Salinarimonas soli TaxID=1638099 RepID=A0A5B2V5H0_9HYPH|nr:DUF6455 family protein [Salinarimonas soli]KAA2234181.1 hypothetical protein F0L46_24190 [Salinarimonas soli]
MIKSLVQRIEMQARLLGEMMERLGVDPEIAACEAGGAGLAAVALRCRACGSRAECRRFLDEATGSVPAAPAFCPNGDFLARAVPGA